MPPSTLAKRAWLLLLAATFVVYLYGLGRAPFLGPDEPRYAQVAREMFERRDLVTPTLAGHTWFEKPALLYWGMIAGFRVFGVSEFAARLVAACAGLFTVLFVGWIAARAERGHVDTVDDGARSFGLISTAVTASSAGLMVFARGASFDILVTMTITATLAFFFTAESEEKSRKRFWLLVGCYAGAGAALLAKGLIGIVIPGGVIALYYVFRRRPPKLLRLGILWGPLVTIGVAATWYAPVIAQHGWTFVDEFFVQHHFARYVSNKYHHPQPPYFYLPILLLLALPWTMFLVAALARARRWEWRGESAMDRLRLFSLAWLVVPVAFFSLSGSKLPGYILPALPGAALLASGELLRYVRGEGRGMAMRVTGGMILLLGVAGMIFQLSTRYISMACALAICLPITAVGGLALVWAQRRITTVSSIVSVTFATVMLIVNCVLDDAARGESVRDLLQQAAQRGYASTPVVQLHTRERTSEFYAARRLAYDEHGEPVKFEGVFQVVDAARRSGGIMLVIVPLEFINQLHESEELEVEVIGDNGSLALVAVKVRGGARRMAEARP